MSEKRQGVLGVDYAEGRRSKRSWRYRLRRRTLEVCRAIETYGAGEPDAILDLGTAEGRMLQALHERFPGARCVGVEFSAELVEFGRSRFPEIELVAGAVQDLEMPDGSFDVVVAAAVLEHLPEAGRLVGEAARVLRPPGLFIATSPDPFWEGVATRLGHLDAGQHTRLPKLGELSAMAEENGLEVLEAEKFMLSPVGMPCEAAVERLLRLARLRFLMANQILVARKPPEGVADASS